MTDRKELLLELLREANKNTMELVHQAAGSPGIGAARLLVTWQVSSCPGSTVSELARAIGLAKSHVSTTVDYLAGQGLVEKRADSRDHRLVRVFPTGRSSERLQRVNELVHTRLDTAFAELGEQQVDCLLMGLGVLGRALADDNRAEEPSSGRPGVHSEGGDTC